jgi:hypothetical protein
MKKVLLFIFIALLVFTAYNSGPEVDPLLDFDDIDHLEIVKA